MDVSPGSGIVKVNQTAPSSYPFTYTFESDTSVSLEAVPAPRYLFTNWSGHLSGTTNPTTILIDCNKSVTANFSKTTSTQMSWTLVGGVTVGIILLGLLVAVWAKGCRA